MHVAVWPVAGAFSYQSALQTILSRPPLSLCQVKHHMGADPRNFSILTKEFTSDANGRVSGCLTVEVEWTKDSAGRMVFSCLFAPLLS